MVRKPRHLFVTFGLVTIVCVAIPPGTPAQTAPAPIALALSVDAAQVGQTLFVEGRGLAGENIEIHVGRAPATGAINPGGSARRIRFEVPNRLDALEPDTVTVSVFVDGVEALYPNGPLRFTRESPQPPASLSGYVTGDPDRPHSVLPGQSFVLTLTGERLETGQRVPIDCTASAHPTTVRFSGEFVEATKTEATFAFGPILFPADYRFHVLFSDGSTATIDAPGFVEPPPRVSPPRIESARAEVREDGAVCDMTAVVERGLCASAGIIGVTAEPPGILLEVLFTRLDLEARVTDPNSTPSQNDVLAVGATLGLQDILFIMRDDGSTPPFLFLQTDTQWLQDCSSEPTPDPPGCACTPATRPVTSNDVTAGDDLYTSRMALINPTTPPIAVDCIIEQTQQIPRTMAAGTLLTPTIHAVDRHGNLAMHDAPPVVTGSDRVGCIGDPCGCCLLLSPSPTLPAPVGCGGLAGMTSADLPQGLCRSF